MDFSSRLATARMAAARALRALCAEYTALNALWERYLTSQRPWAEEWLRWIPTEDGARLAGSVLPPTAHMRYPSREAQVEEVRR